MQPHPPNMECVTKEFKTKTSISTQTGDSTPSDKTVLACHFFGALPEEGTMAVLNCLKQPDWQ